MLFSNLKKSLFVGTLLALVSVNSAFAAEAPTTKGLTENTKPFSIIEKIFDIDDLDDLEDLKDILRKHHYHHGRHDWDDRWENRHDWDNDDYHNHRHEMRQERKERIDHAMKQLSYSQRREVTKFIEKDREFQKERHEALRKMNKKQRQAVKAHYYGHHYKHQGRHHGNYGCYNK